MTAVYENEELLNQAQVIAAKWWKMYGHHVYETIVFDGPVMEKVTQEGQLHYGCRKNLLLL